MMLQPTCPAAAEVAQPIKNNYSAFHFPSLPDIDMYVMEALVERFRQAGKAVLQVAKDLASVVEAHEYPSS
jgi:hypothetical protein